MVVSGSITLEFTYVTFTNIMTLLFTTDETGVRNGFEGRFVGKKGDFYAKYSGAYKLDLKVLIIKIRVKRK